VVTITIQHKCGVAGVYGQQNASKLVYNMLYMLQHRAHEAAGIVSSDGSFHSHRGEGLVGDVFKNHPPSSLKGNLAIGHVRYSTEGESNLVNAQPIFAQTSHGWLAVAHNGELVNYQPIRDKYECEGAIFQSTSDTEVFLHNYQRSKAQSLEERIFDAVRPLEGAFSLTMMTEDTLVAVRDPRGFRPLSIGKTAEGGYLVASETRAFDLVQDSSYLRDVEPGEVVFIESSGMRSYSPFDKVPSAQCLFEIVYLGMPDSKIFGVSVQDARFELGRQLAREHPAEADLVTPVPDSGNHYAAGYAFESEIPFIPVIVRSHYLGRTFIRPSQAEREQGVDLKLGVGNVEGKRVVVVDDSLVRGNTSKRVNQKLKAKGAEEVHERIACPPIVAACYYGVDHHDDELLARSRKVEDIRNELGLTSLGFLSLESLRSTVDSFRSGLTRNFCDACWTGNYPTQTPK
jgi:amidophosphoribosyltransferase